MHFPRAIFRGPIANMSPKGMQHPIKGLVLHIMEGSITSADNWFRDPKSQASAHFGNAKDGRLWQWVDTDDKAWAEVAGNPRWLSIENEGIAPTSLTPQQLENVAELLAWMHTTYGVPLQVTDDPNGEGLGWHGMGGAAWGGHFGCPGEPIKAQRAAIVARAEQIVVPKPAPPKPPPPSADQYAASHAMVRIDAAEAKLAIAHGISYYVWRNGQMIGSRSAAIPVVVLFAFAANLDAAGIPAEHPARTVLGFRSRRNRSRGQGRQGRHHPPRDDPARAR
jgi:hypothetical protein